MRALITGAGGQLGQALYATAPEDWNIVAADRDTLDLSAPSGIAAFIARTAPQVIINAAAYTAVDRAESEPEAAALVNATAVEALAHAADAIDAHLIHVSTDFVFDGSASSPITPEAPTNPLSVYGRTKREGERLALAASPRTAIVRTAWLYAARGANFVNTMLRLMAERPELRVVADQIGAPTHAAALARRLWTFAARGTNGIWHYSDAGAASWYDFAVAIQEEALEIGLLNRAVPVRPIRTEDYPTPATRPSYSLLDSTATMKVTGLEQEHWRVNLREMLMDLKNG